MKTHLHEAPVFGRTAFASPGTLVSLMALLKFNAELYRNLGKLATVCLFLEMIERDLNDVPMEDITALKKFAGAVLRDIRKDYSVAHQQVITKQIDRALNALNRSEYPQWLREVNEAESRINDLLKGQEFYVISPDKSERYHNPLALWGEVIDKFPSAMDAIEDAEKCYALGQSTACVYHCMATVHCGLLALGKDVGAIFDVRIDTWETIINSIQGAINRKQQSMTKKEWKEIEPFYGEAISDLRSIKAAWRNPTMHFTRSYDGAQAAKIIARVREFMVNLSTGTVR